MSDIQAQTADWFSVDEIARAAGVSAEQAWRSIGQGQALVHDRHVSAEDAMRLVRVLRGLEAPSRDRFPFNRVPTPPRKEMRRGVVLAGAVHVIALILIFSPALFGLQSERDNEIKSPEPEVKLVFLMQLGKGGGGGGGGLREKTPAPPAKHKAPVALPKRVASPVPPARPKAAPPQPTPEPPKPEVRPQRVIAETPVERPAPPPPPPPPAVEAPVKSIPADPVESRGLPEAPPREPSRGTGDRGGVGSGSGQGIGEGSGGLGAGTGGGTGGGVYQPGAGIDPPTLVREVRPIYTDDARRQRIQGDVILEIVVRSDGSVGSIRVRRSLGGGLDQRAIEAVRQWRFNPARRHGTPVDVAVEVAVEFKLR